MEPIISARGLGKSYQIRTGEKKRYHTLRDDLIEGARGFVQGKWKRSRIEEFWALKDIDLDIYPGEVVGIVGRNGAGKSTLLKILSRVVQPTTGEAVLHGRVASLLEVGTGFHPELTGRENIFMSGAVLGMQQAEIRRKFGEIVAFAEVEKFLDTPVKRYSSGMYVRLAFAVAAHLEPDILLVDEVLAVGDAAFQKKCLGKMEDVSKSGRTVLFVSHQMGMINQLCDQAFLLEKGTIVQKGKSNDVITSYLEKSSSNQQRSFIRDKPSEINKKIFVSEARTLNKSGISTSEFGHTEPILLNLICLGKQCPNDTLLSITVKDRLGKKIFSSEVNLNSYAENINKGALSATVRMPEHFLTPGRYSFFIGLHIPKLEILDSLEDMCEFTIIDTGSEFAIYEGLDYGCVFAKCDWNITTVFENH
ncbi:ABC transporter ATP-binding protein [Leptolyngbya sp. FACHB-321]|uniref:ABC transporter ATP-binding protein n=1 Tax=Leptolyngbya sp. FACHB-321 TaxID=2692807 RepID=UPI0016883AF6|nr:ABC transporter ATP-binding protein [Leptolyngbya sp. FACHB-321]MBD2037924.1 ABC transporter ATP-binding protein [Leptolyngbya sp. FACHB-321]